MCYLSTNYVVEISISTIAGVRRGNAFCRFILRDVSLYRFDGSSGVENCNAMSSEIKKFFLKRTKSKYIDL